MPATPRPRGQLSASGRLFLQSSTKRQTKRSDKTLLQAFSFRMRYVQHFMCEACAKHCGNVHNTQSKGPAHQIYCFENDPKLLILRLFPHRD